MNDTKIRPVDYTSGLRIEPLDLTEMTSHYAALDDLITKEEASIKRQKEELQVLRATILRTLDLMGIDSVKMHGLLFYKENKTSVATPKTLEDKKALFDFLESQGIFLEIVSVNSQTLNSLYKSLAEKALEGGDLDFKLPGVAEPTTFTNLKTRKA